MRTYLREFLLYCLERSFLAQLNSPSLFINLKNVFMGRQSINRLGFTTSFHLNNNQK